MCSFQDLFGGIWGVNREKTSSNRPSFTTFVSEIYVPLSFPELQVYPAKNQFHFVAYTSTVNIDLTLKQFVIQIPWTRSAIQQNILTRQRLLLS